jgi:stage IV sporulation protein B
MLLPGGGKAENVRVTSVTKGKEGVPGELNGDFSGKMLGEIYLNTETGAYFKYDAPVSGEKVQVADHSEVTEGNATIISTIDGTEPKPYSVRIVKVIKSSLFTTKGMLIEVTDEKLLQKTGGVVCGMSGSPIIQNGKLIGAVTHVFVNDPTRGYGIFIDNMYSKIKSDAG